MTCEEQQACYRIATAATLPSRSLPGCRCAVADPGASSMWRAPARPAMQQRQLHRIAIATATFVPCDALEVSADDTLADNVRRQRPGLALRAALSCLRANGAPNPLDCREQWVLAIQGLLHRL